MSFQPQDGQTYFCVGPLQSRSGLEKWVWTDDVYDNNRLEIGNVFETIQSARAFKEFLVDLKGKNDEK